MSEETSLHLYYSIISLASLIEFSGEVILLYNYTVFRYARYGIIPTVLHSVLEFKEPAIIRVTFQKTNPPPPQTRSLSNFKINTETYFSLEVLQIGIEMSSDCSLVM
jgi:hypothetical protein